MEKVRAVEIAQKYINCAESEDCVEGCRNCPNNYNVDDFVEAIKKLVEIGRSSK